MKRWIFSPGFASLYSLKYEKIQETNEICVELAEIVPWGRSFAEYQAMFALEAEDLGKKILGCGDGPACFNAELTARGGDVVSVDPIYTFSHGQIRAKIEEVSPRIMTQVQEKAENYIWKNIRDPEHLQQTRMDSMQRFLDDYRKNGRSGRYISASLPHLPFPDNTFDLALCSHYLFLYSDHVDEAHHILSMKELCRVAREVRVYPLLSMGTNAKSPHLEPVQRTLEAAGITVSVVSVPYEFQKGAREMLVSERLPTEVAV